jgi:hypothetical protein
MRRRFGTLAIAALIIVGGLVPAVASPASAHDSSYCGHGTDGIVWVTEYGGLVNNPADAHLHRYFHVHRIHGRHTRVKQCPAH